MQYSQEHLKTMVYAEFGGQTECVMGNWKIENRDLVHKALTRRMSPEGYSTQFNTGRLHPEFNPLP